MDGSFACPECGSDVEVRGLAPGRQVRCGFCHRLLEVPYLPRAAERVVETPSVRASEMGRLGMGRARRAAGRGPGGGGRSDFCGGSTIRFRSDRSTSLLESSQRHEAEGRLGEALIDLDAALDLADKAGPAWVKRLERERSRRPDLARRDAEAILDGLCRSTSRRRSAWETGST